MPEDRDEELQPDSGADQYMQVVRTEVEGQIQTLMEQYMPGGLPAMMDQIVERVVTQIKPLLPTVDYEKAGQKALELARAEMGQEADKIGAEIEAKVASANGSGSNNGVGPGGPSNNGHNHDDHDDQHSAEPEGYVFPKVNGAKTWKDAIRQQVMGDPLTIINMVFDKGFNMMERWHHLNKPDDLLILQNLQATKPQLFNSFVPHPWGPEFQKMMEQSFVAGLKAKMGQGVEGYNPFGSGAAPSAGYATGIGSQRQPLFGESASVIEYNGRLIGDTIPATTTEYATLSNLPKSMADMLAGD